MSLRHPLTALLLVSLVGACGGGGSDDQPTMLSTPTPKPPSDSGGSDAPAEPIVVSGQFKDVNVVGLDFESGLQTGITDANGAFTCEVGQKIIFSVAAVELGSSECTEVVTPLSLFQNSTLDTLEVLNVVRFLLLLDDNRDASDGIEISSHVRQLAGQWGQVNFSTIDFESELAPIIDDLATDDRPVLVDESTARAHLLSTMRCIVSGVYWLDLTADTFMYSPGILAILPAEVDGVVMRGFAWATDENGAFSYAAPASAISFGQVTRIEFSDLSNEPTFQGAFTSASRLEGTWGEAGVFQADRAREASQATYQFVGYSEDSSCCGSALTIHLSEDNQASATSSWLSSWDPPYNLRYEGSVELGQLSLTRTDDSDETISGAVDLQATPPVIRATWTNASTGGSGSYTTYGCRLN